MTAPSRCSRSRNSSRACGSTKRSSLERTHVARRRVRGEAEHQLEIGIGRERRVVRGDRWRRCRRLRGPPRTAARTSRPGGRRVTRRSGTSRIDRVSVARRLAPYGSTGVRCDNLTRHVRSSDAEGSGRGRHRRRHRHRARDRAAARRARRAHRRSAAATRRTSSRDPRRCGTPASIRWPCRSTCAIRSRSTRWSSARVKHFGRIDILVNNAAGNFICRAEELSPNGWNAVVGIVLNGSFYCSRAVGRHMIARGSAAARSCRSSPTTSGPAAPAPSTRPRPRPA